MSNQPFLESALHRRINNYLTVVVVAFGLYITVLPWLPQLQFWLDKQTDNSNGYVYRGNLSTGAVDDTVLADPPEDNTLVIPELGLDETVLEGNSLSVLNDGGVWRRPNTSTPDQGGNTVIIGHRFSYSSPSTFYHLDKLSSGDRFAVWWQQQEYVYEVYETKVVPATALEIENNTSEPIVTLYTCTPLWTAKDRLVIRARLVQDTPSGATT